MKSNPDGKIGGDLDLKDRNEKIRAALALVKQAGISEVLRYHIAHLPADIRGHFIDLGLATTDVLVFFLNAGGEFWLQLEENEIRQGWAFDRKSFRLIQRFANLLEAPVKPRVLYPGDSPVPLAGLLDCAGFAMASRLGLAIHPEFGTWFAVRALFSLPVQLPLSRQQESVDVCGHCLTRDCVAACPAGAVSPTAAFDLDACANFRLREKSSCADSCIARRRCPIGAQYRYPLQQSVYHAANSLAAIRRYRMMEQ